VRIAIGQLWQETNTFNPVPTTRKNFEDLGVLRGAQVIESSDMSMEPGGMMARLRAWPEPPELIGLVRLPAWPGGPIDEAAFQWLMEEMLSALDAAGPVDAVLLALHGALVGVGHPDVEGELLASVRQRIGPKVPLVATLDLHVSFR
jgi:microcystin degradation protein MlrC